MVRLIISLAVITMTVFPAAAASDTKYMLTERYNRPFCDMDKTNKGDSRMCWAASISNMVEFAGGSDTKVTFNYLKREYGNKPGSIYSGLLSIFKSFGFSVENFLLLVSFDYRKVNKRMDLCIIGVLYQGKVATIGIDKTLTTKVGHALTAYGFEKNNNKIYIFYVDSNDGIRKLHRERIKHRRGVTRFTTGKYKGYVVDSVCGLQVF